MASPQDSNYLPTQTVPMGNGVIIYNQNHPTGLYVPYDNSDTMYDSDEYEDMPLYETDAADEKPIEIEEK